MESDAVFAHPRLAPRYEAFDGQRDDLAAYLDIAAEVGAGRVLDIGSCTGSLAILLAASGRTVVGSTRPWRRSKSPGPRTSPRRSPGSAAMPPACRHSVPTWR